MIIRRYTKADVPMMIRLLKEGLDQFHYGRIDYDEDKMKALLLGNLQNRSFFCNLLVDDTGDIGGCLAGSITEYMFSHEAFADTYITYIRDGFRSLPAITGLVTEYKAWAKRRGAKQIRWGQSTGYKMDKFAILARRLGFEQIGTNWNMEIN